MLNKLLLALLTLDAFNRVIGLDKVFVSSKAHINQLNELRQKKWKGENVTEQQSLMQPFTPIELKELENAAGIALYDIGPHETGRILQIERDLTVDTELYRVETNVRALPWVAYAWMPAPMPDRMWNQVYISFAANEDQWYRRKQSRRDILHVDKELMQPLTREELTELENAAGMVLHDIGWCENGRLLNIERELSDAEIINLTRNLEKVPWVARTSLEGEFRIDPPPRPHKHRDALDPSFWRKSESNKPRCENMRQGRPSSQHMLSLYKEKFCTTPQKKRRKVDKLVESNLGDSFVI